MSVIDLHCDTIDRLFVERTSLLANPHHVDLNKLKAGNYLAQWFALFIDTKSAQMPLMELAQAMYNYFIKELEQHQQHIGLARNFKEYEVLKKQQKIAAFLSVEEGQIIEGKLENIDKLCEMGVRMMTLTWNYANDLGAPHSSHLGLTAFGKQVVSYLKDTPILIDISHLSETAVKEVRQLYQKPIIASHCNAKEVCNHTRNISDEIIKYIAESGGIIGVNLYGLFLDGGRKSTLEAIKRHIHHFYQLGGEDILALGTDFDGISCELEVCNAGEMGKLIDVLEKIYPKSLIDKLMYQNVERIIKENLS